MKHSSDPWPHLGGHGGTDFVPGNGPGHRNFRGGCSRLRRRRDLQLRPEGAVAGADRAGLSCRRRGAGLGPYPADGRNRRSRRVRARAAFARLRSVGRQGLGGPRSDRRLPDDSRARSLGQQRGAARGLSLFRAPRGRDQADRFLRVPRPERQLVRRSVRACFRQCAGHRGLPLGRRRRDERGPRLVEGHPP